MLTDIFEVWVSALPFLNSVSLANQCLRNSDLPSLTSKGF
jgi:hypothetical protein